MTRFIDRSTFIETALDLALEAGEQIMAIYETDFAVDSKSDSSPVTEADTTAETIILAGLRRAYPALPLIAEEAVAAGHVPEIDDTFILIDPLDGTREFTGRNGAFTVNIALIENGTPVAGIVHAPALGRTFGGIVSESAGGAFELVGGTRRAIATRQSTQGTRVAVASLSHRDADTDAFLKKAGVTNIVSIGSSLKFCLLAAGEADLYPRYGRTMEWDTAAGHAVLAAAGGIVTRTDGAAFLYGKTDQPDDTDFANPGFIAYGDPSLAMTPVEPA